MSLSEVLETLGSFLVRFKVYALKRKVGSGKCNGEHCQVCLNIIETDTFDSFQTKQKYKINHHLNCNNKCLIYLLPCKVCGLQCDKLINFASAGKIIKKMIGKP